MGLVSIHIVGMLALWHPVDYVAFVARIVVEMDWYLSYNHQSNHPRCPRRTHISLEELLLRCMGASLDGED